MKKYISLAVAAIAISGCVGEMPEYKSSNSSMIIFKTPTVKYADQGFVSKADDETKVEIYSMGQALMRLRITPSQVCMSSLECMSGDEFNKKVLKANYPADTIEHIFRGEKIYGGKNAKALADGFIQNIGTVTYKVSGKNITFKDSATGTKIKVVRN